MDILETARKNAQCWLSDFFDKDTQKEVLRIMQDPELLKDSFHKDLEFGTGGMRGVMGVGTNRINKYTLGRNTQGISSYLKELYPSQKIRVAIAYDCRHNSKSLARVVAEVFSSNGIEVFLFSDIRPTPELSFAVRHLKCNCGVVLTASHNPPQYNGYKVYWSDGAQVVPPTDSQIMQRIEATGFDDIEFEANESLIHEVGDEIDQAFINACLDCANIEVSGKEDFKVVYTPLHGTSVKILPQVMQKAGYSSFFVLEEQSTPDGDFPTVKSPNPEEPEALSLALAKAQELGADMVIGTDPDSDRLGVAVRDFSGRLRLLNGNQTMVVMTKFLLERAKTKGLKGNEFIASTIVSTPLMGELAKSYGVECKVGLTGFKWIAKMIADFPSQRFIGGGEESFGFMAGDFVRDKDAITASLLCCAIGAAAKSRGSSFFGELVDIYKSEGLYKERLISITKQGISGTNQISQMMKNLRDNPMDEIAGERVVLVEDYQSSISTNLITKQRVVMDIPKSNVLIYYTEKGSKIAARPSGTEPKIKFYFSANLPLGHRDDFLETESKVEQKIDQIIEQMQLN